MIWVIKSVATVRKIYGKNVKNYSKCSSAWIIMQKINVVLLLLLLLLLQHIIMILHSTASCCCCNCSFNIHDHCICTSRTIHNQSFFPTQTIIPSFHSLEFLQAQNPCCQIRFVVAGRNLATAPPLQMSFHLPPSLPSSQAPCTELLCRPVMTRTAAAAAEVLSLFVIIWS